MSAAVVDASVAVKWFLPEVHAEAARRLLTARRELFAPDLIWAEVGSALGKKVRRAELTAEHARGILEDFRRFPLRTYPIKALLEPAWDLVERVHLSIYDALYLALAVQQACAVVTADWAFHRSLQGGPLTPAVRWIGDLP